MSDEDATGQGSVLPFEGETDAGRLIRRQWHEGQWFFSVVDVVAVLTESEAPRQYWGVLKRRLQDEGASELLTSCLRLKMRALDGKQRETDAANVETMLRLVQSIPSPRAEPIKQWLARVGTERLEEIAQGDALAGLSDDQRRLFTRGVLTERNLSLADAAAGAGVVSQRDFAIFQDHGYMGLYNGERARDIAARKGLQRGQHILDYMGSTELAANLFRATQADDKLRREGITGKAAANQTHLEMGRAVRGFILEQGGTPPEQLPTPTESIQQLQRRERQRLEAERQPPLFLPQPEREDE